MMPPNRTFREVLHVMFPNRSPKHNPIESIRRWLYSLNHLVRRIGHMLRSQNVLFIGFGTFLALGANLPFWAIAMEPKWTVLNVFEFVVLGWIPIMLFLSLIWRWINENERKMEAEKNSPIETMRVGLAQLMSDQQLINAINQVTEKREQALETAREKDERIDRLITATEQLVQRMDDGKID